MWVNTCFIGLLVLVRFGFALGVMFVCSALIVCCDVSCDIAMLWVVICLQLVVVWIGLCICFILIGELMWFCFGLVIIFDCFG